MAFVIRALQRKIRGRIPDANVAASRNAPKRLERKKQEGWPRHVLHGAREIVRRLQHCRKQRA